MTQLLIIDTNVLVAGLLSRRPESPTVQLLDAMVSGSLLFLLSPALLQEYRSVLMRPRLAQLHGLDDTAVDELLTALTANAIWREPDVPADQWASAPPDPGDAHLWALMACEPRAVLITGDLALTRATHPGCNIVQPVDWLHAQQPGTRPCRPQR